MQAHSLFSAPGRRLPSLVPKYTKPFRSLLLTASRAVSYLSSLQNLSHTFQGRLQPLHLQPLVCLSPRLRADGSNWLPAYRGGRIGPFPRASFLAVTTRSTQTLSPHLFIRVYKYQRPRPAENVTVVPPPTPPAIPCTCVALHQERPQRGLATQAR